MTQSKRPAVRLRAEAAYRAREREKVTSKPCLICKVIKPIEEFSKKGNKRFARCNQCRRDAYQLNKAEVSRRARAYYWANREKCLKNSHTRYRINIKERMVCSAKRMAKKKNVPFNLTVNDFVIPKMCPLLGVELKVSERKSSPTSPSLDRIRTELGYVSGNVMVISRKANTIKSDASLKELQTLTENLSKYVSQ